MNFIKMKFMNLIKKIKVKFAKIKKQKRKYFQWKFMR